MFGACSTGAICSARKASALSVPIRYRLTEAAAIHRHERAGALLAGAQ
jgi:hypothetical protein